MFILNRTSRFHDHELSSFELKSKFGSALNSEIFDQTTARLAEYATSAYPKGETQYILTKEDARVVYKFNPDIANVCTKITIKNASLTHDAYFFWKLGEPTPTIICLFSREDLISVLPLLTNLLIGAGICSEGQVDDLNYAFNLAGFQQVIDEAEKIIKRLDTDTFAAFAHMLGHFKRENAPVLKEAAKLLIAKGYYHSAIAILQCIVPSFGFPSACKPNDINDLFVRSHVEIIKCSLADEENITSILDRLYLDRYIDLNAGFLFNIATALMTERYFHAAIVIFSRIESKLGDVGKELVRQCQFEAANIELSLFAPSRPNNQPEHFQAIELKLLSIEQYAPGAKPLIGKLLHELAGFGLGYLCDKEGTINLHNYTDISETIRIVRLIREQNQLLNRKDLEIKELKEKLATNQRQTQMQSEPNLKPLLTTFTLNATQPKEADGLKNLRLKQLS